MIHGLDVPHAMLGLAGCGTVSMGLGGIAIRMSLSMIASLGMNGSLVTVAVMSVMHRKLLV